MDSLQLIITDIDTRIFATYIATLKERNESCDFHNGLFIYTHGDYKTKITMELLRYPGKKPICSPADYTTAVNKYFTWKIEQYYLPRITIILNRIGEQQNADIKQKSDEWITLRQNVITASEAGYLLGITGYSAMVNYITKKCDIPTSLETLQYCNSIKHGNTYESVSRMIYESRNNATIAEYGLIKTDKCPIFAASPDGIITKCKDPARIGRLVEFKNPYSWTDKVDIKPEYVIQIYQQQFVMDIPICDFVKTHIIGSDYNPNADKAGFRQYISLDDMLGDTIPEKQYAANEHIPRENCCSLGTEKGVLLQFNDLDKIFVYPISIPYTRDGILEWIDGIKKEHKESMESKESNGVGNTDNPDNFTVKYWYIADYTQKTLVYDQKLYEHFYMPRLKLVWDIIQNLRAIPDIPSRLNCIDNIVKPHLKEYKPAYYKDIANQAAICKMLDQCITEIKTCSEISIPKATLKPNKIVEPITNKVDKVDRVDKVDKFHKINKTGNIIISDDKKTYSTGSRKNSKKIIEELDF